MKAIILGGTGTLGQELTKQLLADRHDVVCFSRCELKQKQMADQFGHPPNLKFILGDVRDLLSLQRAMRGADACFHVAALKHVDVLESNPEESVKTNILGTMNVAEAAISEGVRYVAFSSTDKAVDPVNVYGMCKGISEKILLQRNETQSDTHFSVFRWGNVLGSRGSVIPFFVRTLREEKKAYITHPNMTRFWIRIEDAVKFMLAHYQTSPKHSVMIPPIQSAEVTAVVRTIAKLLHIEDFRFQETGVRPGEKLHESLWSIHDGGGMSSDSLAHQYEDLALEDLLRSVVGQAS